MVSLLPKGHEQRQEAIPAAKQQGSPVDTGREAADGGENNQQAL